MGLLQGIIDGTWRAGRTGVDWILRPLRLDAATHDIITIDHSHHEVHEGEHFFCVYSVASVGALTSPDDLMTLTFVTPNTDKVLHMIGTGTSSNAAVFSIIEGGSGGGSSPTGELSVYNSNRNSNTVSTILASAGGNAAKISYDATAVTGGVTLKSVFLGTAGVLTASAGSARSEEEIILKKNTQYQMSIGTTATVPGSILLSWYEDTPKN